MKKLIICCLLLLSISVQAQFIKSQAPTTLELEINNANTINSLLQVAAKASKQKDYKNLVVIYQKIVKIKPQVPGLKFQLAEAFSLNNEKTGAFNTLIELQKQGMYFDLDKSPNFENIKSYPVFGYIKENMDANKAHFGQGETSFFIDKNYSGLLFESIAFNSNNNSFLMGSLRDGSVINIAGNGEVSLLVEAVSGGKQGPWATLDLAVDSENDILWVGSSAITQFGKLTKETVGLSGIFKYKLSTGKLLKAYPLPEKTRPNAISSIHLTAQGDLYLISASKNVVLKLDITTGNYSVVFSTVEYNNLRNITSDETGRFLYLSDVERGIIVISLDHEAIFNLAGSDSLNLTNISDIIYDDSGLIIIQSGFLPERVLRLKLREDKINIENILPIESSHPSFKSPSYGVVVDEGLYYIANSQLHKTNVQGGLIKGMQWENVEVISSAKHYEEELTMEYKKSIERYKKASGIK